jgi:predicted nucleotidyltransferase
MLGRRGGWAIQHQLGQMLLDQTLVIYEIQQDAHNRILELMAQYQDRPMDLANATLVLTAEKTGYRKILTLGSDFLFYRIGDNLDNNDINILVEYEKAPSLWQLIELRDYLSELFTIKVDVATRNGLKARIRDRILAEVIYL